jgi:hypothetical protein
MVAKRMAARAKLYLTRIRTLLSLEALSPEP